MRYNLKHGMSSHRLYSIWDSMKSRCYRKTTAPYAKYGGRGITVCDEWKNSFQAFYDWAMENGYRDDLSIDRIDVNGSYCPENCRWVTMREQENNRRNNKLITYNGETHTQAEWCELLSIPPHVMTNRLKRGWSIERAFTTKVRRYTTYG